jgi:hypothetical protein
MRTMGRIFRVAKTCSPGCDETWANVFTSKESILWWCLTNHFRVKGKMRANITRFGVYEGSEVDTSKRKSRRIGGWGSQLKEWLKAIDDMVRSG